MKLVPCPFCKSTAISLLTRTGETRAYANCFNCDAKGPSVGNTDTRPWDQAAAEEWNLWATAKGILK